MNIKEEAAQLRKKDSEIRIHMKEWPSTITKKTKQKEDQVDDLRNQLQNLEKKLTSQQEVQGLYAELFSFFCVF